MKQFILKNKKAITSIIGMLLIGAVTMSFQENPIAYGKFLMQDEYEGYCADTLPDKEGMSMQDFDKLQREIDKSLLLANEEIKKIDVSKLKKEIEASLKNVDMDHVIKEAELALKSIDLDKIMAEVSASIKNLTVDYKSAEIEKAIAASKEEIEKAKLEIKEINKDVIQKELEHAKKEIENSKQEISKINIDKILADALTGINEAKEEMHLTKELFTEMEKDGLINPRNGFTVEYKNKDLFINGKKQSDKTTDKYRKYFKQDHFKMTIEKE